MGVEKLFMTAVKKEEPLDGSGAAGGAGGEEAAVSDFLTIQSLTNFAAMTGAISAAWSALIVLNATWFSSKLVPFAFAVVFGIVSLLISPEALKKSGNWHFGRIAATVFIGLINSLILFSAVIGAGSITSNENPQQPADTTTNQVVVRPYG